MAQVKFLLVADLGETVSQLGLAALVAALVAALLAARRDKLGAEREWLRGSLEAFYAPISAKLELMHLSGLAHIEDLRRSRESERETVAKIRKQYADKSREGSKTLVDHRVQVSQRVHNRKDREWMKSNIRTQHEISEIIEQNLHYVEDAGVQREALEFVTRTRLSEWEHVATNLDLESDNIHVMVTQEDLEELQERDPFHQLMLREFDARAERFRRLSRGGIRVCWRRPPTTPPR